MLNNIFKLIFNILVQMINLRVLRTMKINYQKIYLKD